MSRRSGRARNRQRGQVSKAIQQQFLSTLPGTGGIARPAPRQTLIETEGMGRLAAFMSEAMPRNPRDLVPFGPSTALRPAQLDPSRPDTRRAEPRISEYEVAFNLPGVTEPHHVSWQTLRAAANSVDIMRRCIELRKDHLASLKWAWTVSPEAVAEAYAANPMAGKTDLERELREQYLPEINRMTEFWRKPWKTHGIKFDQWVRGMMEEHLVLDAVVVYPEVTYGGDVLALNLIDGSTIKPLRDYRGQRPQPPFPAYQQELYGFPRGEFTATVGEDGQMAGGYLSDQLYYYRRNFRVRSMFGFSPTEQALIAARLYLRRQGWMLSEYDDGVVPQLIMKLSETTALTPTERRQYEETLNDELTGQTRQRHRAKVAFPGMDPVLLPSVDERYKPDYDLHLLKMIASFYGVSMTSLGFTESRGLGSSGMHQAQADAEEIASINPDQVMIADLVNELSHNYLGIPDQIAFSWVEDEGDETLQGEQANQILLTTGQATINDGRRRQGLPLFTEPEADMPFILGGQGPVFLSGTFAAQQAAQAAQQAQHAAAAQPAGQGPDQKKPQVNKAAGGAGVTGSDIVDAVRAQLADDYPSSALAWLDDAEWSGPEMVDVADLDLDDKESWSASHDPGRVKQFAKRMKHGHMKPIVVVSEPGKEKMIVIDGHHRTLAADSLGAPVLAYIGKVESKDGPWSELHSQQHGTEAPDGDEPVSAPPAASNPKAMAAAPCTCCGGTGEHDGGNACSCCGGSGMASAQGKHDGPCRCMDTARDATVDAAKALEARQYRAWKRKGSRGRPFDWRYHTTHEVVALEKATGSDGGDDPKEQAPGLPAQPPDHSWPAWAVDTALAMLVASRLRRAMARGLGIPLLTERFLRWARGVTGTDIRPNVKMWLTSVGMTPAAMADAIGPVLREASAEASAAGVRSAVAVLTGDPVDWKGWAPGNVRAARLILSEDGTEVGLQRLLDDASVRISRIAENRLDEVASVLADGLERGLSPREISVALRGIVDDEVWALTVAWTETNRAQSAAALDLYRARGTTGKSWFTARDQRVCPVCQANKDDGVIPLDQAFSSGEQFPPGHPRCRCAPVPGDLPADAGALPKVLGRGNPRALHDYWVRGKGRAKWVASPHPFATLRALLAEYIHDPDELDATTAQWVHDGTGHWPGRGHDKALAGSLDKVGPHGYIHGWIFVGIPGVGEEVRHPKHGKGIVTSHAGGMLHADFKTGSHSFETAPKARPPRGLRPRHHEKVMHTSQIRPGDKIKGDNGRYREVRAGETLPSGRIKVRTERPEFEKVRGAEAKEMNAWARDARKPGRKQLPGETRGDYLRRTNALELTAKREFLDAMTASAEREASVRGLRGGERERYIERATAMQRADVAEARARVDYAASYVNTEPIGADHAKFRAARSINPDRPLSVYGDMLTIHDRDVRTYASVKSLETDVPPHTHALMARYLAEKSSRNSGVYVGSGPVPDLDDLSHLRGSSLPVGPGESRASWDQAGGVFVRPTIAIGYAGDWGMDTVHAHSTATHELGHGLDAALGDVSRGQAWRDRHAAMVAEAKAAKGGRWNPYYERPEEFWAEGFSRWSAGQARGGGIVTQGLLQDKFNLSAASAASLATYYAGLDQQIKEMAHEY